MVKTMTSAENFKREIKEFMGEATVEFIPLPLIPKLTKLQDDKHDIIPNRLEDMLSLNDFFANKISDTTHNLSLENLGLKPQEEVGSCVVSFKSFDNSSKIKLVSKEHDVTAWRENGLENGVDLKDPIRRQYWLHNILKFFDF